MSKYDKMIELNRAKSDEKITEAKLAIRKMIEDGDKISIPQLMKMTGLSRGFFYKNPTVRAEINQALEQQAGMMAARTLHLFSSYWGLILMSLHTGMHWKLVLGMCRSKAPGRKGGDVFLWLLRGAAFGIALFGVYGFMRQRMADYLFMQTHFVFFDETKSVWMFYAEVTAVIGMFLVAGHYLGVILQKWSGIKMGKRIAKILAFGIPAVIVAIVIFSLNHGK